MRVPFSILFFATALFTLHTHGGQSVPPTISSPVNAVGQINTPFSYKIVATGDAPITYGAAGLPEGLTLSADTITGTPTEFGSFIVTLSATNLVNTDTESLTLDIQPLAVGNGSLSNIDRDGDTFSDELEIALNSDEKKQSSVPFGGLAETLPTDIVVEKLLLRFNFLRERRDTLSTKGRIIVDDNAPRGGVMFVVDAGGVVQAVSLDSRGKSIQTEDDTFRFQLNLPRSGATGITRVAKYNLSIRTRNLFNQYTDEGFTKTTGGTLQVPYVVIFDGKIYRTTVAQNYTVKANKNGKTK
jgi:hypothetical protein